MKLLPFTSSANAYTPINYPTKYFFLKKVSLVVLLLFPLLTTVYLSAQHNVRYELAEVLDKTDGLSSNKITSIYSTIANSAAYNNKRLILGTNNGANLYDGYSFQLFNNNPASKYPLTGNKIGGIEIDKDAYVWIATNRGLDRIDVFRDSHFRYFNVGNKYYPSNEKGRRDGNLVTQTADGQFWVVNNGVLHKVGTEEIKPFLEDRFQHIKNIIADGKGNFYFFNQNKLIGLNSEGNILFEKNDILEGGRNGKLQLSSNLYRSKDGDIILTTNGYKHYFKLAPNGNVLPIAKADCVLVESIEIAKAYAKKEGHSIFHVSDYLYDDQGIQWLGTNFGLVKIVPKYDYFSKIQALRGKGCRGLYEHSNGLIFGGTYSNSFFCYNPINQQVKWIDGIKYIYNIQQQAANYC